MTARIIDGKAIAASLQREIASHVATLAASGHRPPGLALILVGDNPASRIYVRNKTRLTRDVGMKSFDHLLPASTSQAELLALVHRLNQDDAVDGILVQLPLPPAIDTTGILSAVDPAKDVDGFHPINAGRLATGQPGLVPCTPRGCLALIQSVEPRLGGLHAVVIGRSNIVGKPMVQLLLQQNCTVTIAHSHTRNLPAVCRQADILAAAVGRPGTIGAEHVAPGAIVVDVGINRLPSGQLAGDVRAEEILSIARAITP
ncbi:MAG: bifunctional methylenetetrahydrofolate dehydrogenase/methenyltetrahydrofolate cyclohydrolase, partial [Acetobacteraceae bacterium]|nr:bifunctional methylenetetrahydrofolate dehydrogenase/methenyltetrahydrofolate cyclohydrolase [Acetobacteraceae bacterium]